VEEEMTWWDEMEGVIGVKCREMILWGKFVVKMNKIEEYVILRIWIDVNGELKLKNLGENYIMIVIIERINRNKIKKTHHYDWSSSESKLKNLKI
jgi:hypothetical protein